MKLHLPFLRKRSRSIPDSSRTPSASSSTSASFSSSTTPSSSKSSSESSSSWTSTLHAQKVSSTGKVVSKIVEPETSGKIDNGFLSPSPSNGFLLPSPKPSYGDQIRELEEVFLRFDANRDGRISVTELGSVLRSLGDNPTEEDLFLMVKEVDKDGDGFIDLEEFILLNSSGGGEGEELRDAFHVFDTDKNGYISAQELYRVLEGLGETCTMEECHRMIKGVDTDGDGFVDFEEFRKMMTRTN